MTPEEKTGWRARIKALFDETFGPNHGCNADISAFLRTDGATTIRFMHAGEFWDLISVTDDLTLTKAP